MERPTRRQKAIARIGIGSILSVVVPAAAAVVIRGALLAFGVVARTKFSVTDAGCELAFVVACVVATMGFGLLLSWLDWAASTPVAPDQNASE